MRITVNKDTTRREIQFKVTEGQAPDLDVTETWHRKTRVIRPDTGTVVILDGEVRRITVAGGLVLKDGSVSDATRDKREWRRTDAAYQQRERIETAPGWVREIWEQAPGGIREYSWSTGELTDKS